MCFIETAPVIETTRLRLRGLRKGDAGAIARLANDEGVLRMTTAMPCPYGIEDAHAFLERAADRDPGQEQTFAIDHPEAGLIGVLGLSPAIHGGSELGYWLGRDHWGRGYATEAAAAALDWARRDWRRRLVVAGHFADNPASGQVLCKAGFLYTGEVQQRHSAARGESAPTRMMVWLA